MIETRENFETKVKLNRKEGNPIASCPKTVGTTLRKRSLPFSIYIYIYIHIPCEGLRATLRLRAIRRNRNFLSV